MHLPDPYRTPRDQAVLTHLEQLREEARVERLLRAERTKPAWHHALSIRLRRLAARLTPALPREERPSEF